MTARKCILFIVAFTAVILLTLSAPSSAIHFQEAPVFSARPVRQLFVTPSPESLTTEAVACSEQFSGTAEMKGFRMIGSLRDRMGLWAVLSDPSGRLYRVAEGQVFGRAGRIAEVTPAHTVIEWPGDAHCAGNIILQLTDGES
ncbi:pilus assembly protein PilP [Photobacterium sp. 53610]|uniref:pilus assembly protein PilP n=1 Tax=Photobacterium sp. 53610 TaxID=3102789 RepID=UPI002EDADB58